MDDMLEVSEGAGVKVDIEEVGRVIYTARGIRIYRNKINCQ
jgi:hypothetical protein